MALRDEIVSYTSELLGSAAFSDYAPNGLQVVGCEEVEVIASAVSCTRDVFERAASAGAQMLLVHHGLFWRSTPQPIDRRMRDRLKVLFDGDINLVAYHLPLDAHPLIGNNALLRDGLGLVPVEDAPFAVVNGVPIGAVGRFVEPLPFAELLERVEQLVDQEPLHLGAMPETVRTVAICSGGGGHMLDEAVTIGADVLLTGEPEEPTHAAALESGIAFIAAGHYATEVCGVHALASRIAERFGLRHEFIASPNPV